ncbi:hypothetical protein QBC47DRAFT_419997 [Echria macrotheca]|uniref:Nucleoside-diphosphate-sugar epimerase n=1 Tax=Echria macrotheca TaxID=438768 RepID=A0AAJ0BJ14_9PEZI|nr:hypothetical protein QBC47DRAFT_419997 [Echria macrotheca]
MHLILTGATGLVGSGILDAMIKNKAVTKISILSRRPVGMADAAHDPRINVILHNDFTSYPPSVLDQLRDAQGCVWALGVSQNQVTEPEYVEITKTYALNAATAFQSLDETKKQPFNFIFISGHGATFTPGRLTPLFGRVKGETELALAEMRRRNPLLRASTARPCAIDWTRHEAIWPFMPRQEGYKAGLMGRGILAAIRVGYKSLSAPTEELGRFVTDMALGRYEGEEGVQVAKKAGVEVLEGGFQVVDNASFRKLSGLD